MIGDRIDNDIIPAKRMGMNTIWIKQGFGQYWNIKEEIEKADFVINNLTELCNLLWDSLWLGKVLAFILASVKGDYGEDIYSLIQSVILLDVPKSIGMQRVKKRSFQKFGNRMLSGGDLYEQEEKFFRLVESRDENIIEEWVRSLKCPVMRIDGTKPIDENTNFIIALMWDKNLFAKEMGNKKWLVR